MGAGGPGGQLAVVVTAGHCEGLALFQDRARGPLYIHATFIMSLDFLFIFSGIQFHEDIIIMILDIVLDLNPCLIVWLGQVHLGSK